MWKKTAAALMIGVMLCGSTGFAAENDHWVYDELKDYKQKIVSYKDGIASNSSITKEEWNSFHTQVLNGSMLNEPISLANWSTGIKMALDLPDGEWDNMLQIYVQGLGNGTFITRENAVGGLVKLLTGSYISGSVTGEQLRSAKALTDAAVISERQRTLVEYAYVLGILDSEVKERFRPQDKLTNAEAVSMLYRVTVKLAYSQPVLPSNHWLQAELASAYSAGHMPDSLKKVLRRAFKDPSNADRNIPVALWHELLMAGLHDVPDDKAKTSSYTLRLAQDGGILRDRAVAGIVILAGASRETTAAEQEKTAALYTDYFDAYDKEKLAIAQNEGLLKGRSEGVFAVNGYLTYAEAAALLIRASLIRLDTARYAAVDAAAATEIAKKMEPSADVVWSTSWVNWTEPGNTFTGWAVEAKYPFGNRMIVYIDPQTGKVAVVTEIEANGLGAGE